MSNGATFVEIGDLRLPLRLSTKRRSIGIKVAAGAATVAAPHSATLFEIQAFVRQKLPWIRKHLQQQRHSAASQPLPQLRFAHGQCFNFLGRPLELCINTAPQVRAAITDDRVEVDLPAHLQNPAIIRQAIKFAYSQAAHHYVRRKIPEYTAGLGAEPKSVSIKEYKSRWGSCNSRRELQFNWLIMQAPQPAVDYVIVHELCHLIHFNHSPCFWSLVEKFAPDYPLWRRWFKENSAALHI